MAKERGIATLGIGAGEPFHNTFACFPRRKAYWASVGLHGSRSESTLVKVSDFPMRAFQPIHITDIESVVYNSTKFTRRSFTGQEAL
jgi:hypothetical protein